MELRERQREKRGSPHTSLYVFCWSFIRAWPGSVPGRNAFQAGRWLRITEHTAGAGLSRAVPHSHFALPSVARQRGDSSLDLLYPSWAVAVGLLGITVLGLDVVLCCLLGFCSPCSPSECFCQDRSSSLSISRLGFNPSHRGLSSSEPCCKFSTNSWIV